MLRRKLITLWNEFKLFMKNFLEKEEGNCLRHHSKIDTINYLLSLLIIWKSAKKYMTGCCHIKS